MKLLAVVIPTKNRPQLLERALQAFRGAAAELEIIVVDDGSSTELADANRSVCDGVDGCQYVHFSRSRGAPAARNHGFFTSHAGYVWFVDDDDYATPGAVDDVLQVVRTAVGSDEVLLLPRSRVLDGTQIHLDVPVDEPRKFERYRRSGIEVTTSCAVFPRDVVSGIGGWDESLRAMQDTDLFLRASRIAKFRCLKTEAVRVDVGHPSRITFAFRASQRGKLQFLRKHWHVLPFRRKVRYMATFILCVPLMRNLRLRWKLRRTRARTKADPE